MREIRIENNNIKEFDASKENGEIRPYGCIGYWEYQRDDVGRLFIRRMSGNSNPMTDWRDVTSGKWIAEGTKLTPCVSTEEYFFEEKKWRFYKITKDWVEVLNQIESQNRFKFGTVYAFWKEKGWVKINPARFLDNYVMGIFSRVTKKIIHESGRDSSHDVNLDKISSRLLTYDREPYGSPLALVFWDNYGLFPMIYGDMEEIKKFFSSEEYK